MEVSSMTRIYELPGEKRNQISTILKIILASNIILKPIKKLKKKKPNNSKISPNNNNIRSILINEKNIKQKSH